MTLARRASEAPRWARRANMGPALEVSLLLPRPELLNVLLRLLIERVAAAGATDVERFALVAHRDRSLAAADDALDLLFLGAQRFAFFGASHLVVIDLHGLAVGDVLG